MTDKIEKALDETDETDSYPEWKSRREKLEVLSIQHLEEKSREMAQLMEINASAEKRNQATHEEYFAEQKRVQEHRSKLEAVWNEQTKAMQEIAAAIRALRT